jgi:hypothetical protein
MPTTRAQVLEAMEFAVVVLSAISPDTARREDFIGATGIDPALINQGRGRQAARVLAGLVAAMRERAMSSNGVKPHAG